MSAKGIFWILCKYLVLVLISISQYSYAQDILEDKDVTHQLWISTDLSYKVSEKFDLTGEIGFKTIWPEVWNRYYLKPGVKFNIPKFMLKKMKYRESLSAGIAF